MLANRRRGAASTAPRLSLVETPHLGARRKILLALAAAGPLLRAASDAADGPRPQNGIAALNELVAQLASILS